MTDWIPFLAARGARFAADGATIAGFSDCPEDTAQTSVLCDLSELEVLAFAGEDAGTFLQGQLTCDVRLATSTQSRRGALCTPKGRALCDRYRAIREACLVDAVARLGEPNEALAQVAGLMRALSGLYDQAARSAATL